MPPLLADFSHARPCKLFCEKSLTLPLFLNERNRITYNELCRKCSNDCKQSFRCIVVLCPKYLSKRRTKNNEADGK